MNIIKANQIGNKNSIENYTINLFILIKKIYKKKTINNLKKKNFKVFKK